MKAEIKFVILIIVLAVLCIFGFCRCSPNKPEKVSEVTKDRIYFSVNGNTWSDAVYRFEYDGHKYIQFGSGDWQTIVHDPDCKCHQKEYIPTEYLY